MTTAAFSLPKSTPPRRRLSGSGTVVGVDIGSQSIKIVQMEANSLRPRVCRVMPHENPPTAFHPELWLEEIDKTLRRAWSSRNRWWPLPAACSLSMKMMNFRTLELPHTEDEDSTPQLLERAFEEDVETSAGSWITEAWATQLDVPSQGHRNCAVLGVEQSLAEGLSAVLWKSGLDCRVLDGLPFVMARAVGGSTTEPVAVIDWGDSTMTLTVVVDGLPYFTRILRGCELHALTTAMQRPLDLEIAQCQQLLTAYGFCQTENGTADGDMASVLADISAPYLHHLHDELHRTWAFLQQLPGQTPKAAILMGGGAAMKNSAAMIQGALPVTTKIWTSPTAPSITDDTEMNSASFASAFALAGLLKNR
jgi:Tfp pilus assembly PilM family ATPase